MSRSGDLRDDDDDRQTVHVDRLDSSDRQTDRPITLPLALACAYARGNEGAFEHAWPDANIWIPDPGYAYMQDS